MNYFSKTLMTLATISSLYQGIDIGYVMSGPVGSDIPAMIMDREKYEHMNYPVIRQNFDSFYLGSYRKSYL